MIGGQSRLSEDTSQRDGAARRVILIDAGHGGFPYRASPRVGRRLLIRLLIVDRSSQSYAYVGGRGAEVNI